MQPEFIKPDFLEDCSIDDIHRRMMNNLPADIDDMPGGFAYDFTRPTAIEKAEMLEFYMVRAIMAMFPQYAWDEHLDLHGQQVHLTRHPASYAAGYVEITGEPGTEIEAGTILATPATDKTDSYEFVTNERCMIGEDGKATVSVTASESGPESNVPSNVVTIMDDPVPEISALTNPEPMRGGADEESDDDFYDRIAMEYANSNAFLGNDNDFIRWAKEAGAGDCIVDDAAEGPGTVKLVIVDANGQPAGEELIKKVYDYIVSPVDRSRRLLPTACAKLICVQAVTVEINFKCTGLQFDNTTNIEQIKNDFTKAVRRLFEDSKKEGVIRYNNVRPLMSGITGIQDFSEFYINDGISNIVLAKEEYPKIGSLLFSQGGTG